jgi:hypothetical protein
MGGISYSEIKKVLADSDIVIYVEAMDLINRMKTRLSFSTKMIDYFESGSCIFAVGWKEAASIKYLAKNNAAFIVTDINKIEWKLKDLIDDPRKILIYGSKAWDCGKRNHQEDNTRRKLKNDIIKLCNSSKFMEG